MSLFKKAAAECLGTFVLVFFAVGTAVMTEANVVATAMAFGLAIVAMAYSIGNISGCHVNPAVSLGVWLSQIFTGKKDYTGKDFVVYSAAQIIGATIGAAALYGILCLIGFNIAVWGTNAIIGDGANGIIGSLLIETILTMIFVYVILVVCNTKGTQAKAGLLIGATLTMVHLLGIGLTGTSVNPARSFGPAFMRSIICTGDGSAMAQYWVFLIAPLAGAILAAAIYCALNAKEAGQTT